MAAVAAFDWTSVEAEWGIHVAGWRLAAVPAPKEAMIRMIQKGHDRADAFSAALFPDEEN